MWKVERKSSLIAQSVKQIFWHTSELHHIGAMLVVSGSGDYYKSFKTNSISFFHDVHVY